MKLIPGHFYLSKDKHIWCCFNVKLEEAQHCQAFCIRLSDSKVSYFFLDGRYDADGKREHSLISEASYDDYNGCCGNCNCYINQIES